MNKFLPILPSIFAALMMSAGGNAMASDNPDIVDGRQLYTDFQCAQCHGADAKSGNTATTPKLAGMNVDDIYVKTKRFIESKAHDDVIKGCGETPNHVQLKKIAEYVATLPR
ncbi:MAG: c-type cytochrome [Rhodocyclaceae bacterium]|nr:c-type cytochrome [Rhodocyclaceae bacterium]